MSKIASEQQPPKKHKQNSAFLRLMSVHWWMARLYVVLFVGGWEAVLNYRKIAPYAEKNHPTDEHLLPLFVALGAGGNEVKGVRLHQSYNYGAFSMAAYAFTGSV